LLVFFGNIFQGKGDRSFDPASGAEEGAEKVDSGEKYVPSAAMQAAEKLLGDFLCES
jgi:hypothetical protein